MADIVTAKRPPPEKSEAIWTRTKVISSFWAVILLLGLPMWWKTTSIYRAELPFDEMLRWAEGSIGQPSFPLEIWISSASLSCVDARRLIQDTQNVLDDLNEFPLVHQRLRYVDRRLDSASKENSLEMSGGCAPDILAPNEDDPALRIEVVLGENPYSFELAKTSAEAVVQFSKTQTSSLPQQLADSLRSTFAEEQISVAHLYTLHAQNNGHAHTFLRSAPGDIVRGVVQRDARAFKQSSTYHVTFSLFTAGGSPSSWDVQQALDVHIRPLVLALGTSCNISIASQVQLYSPFSPSIQLYQAESRSGPFIRQEDLSAFVNAAEWPLSPSIGSGPTINLVIYVPAKEQMPLTIGDSNGDSWLIPQWGGITIMNPPLHTHPETGLQSGPLHLTKELLDGPFQTFSAQILSLLGVPYSHASLVPLRMRLSSHQRLAALSLFLRASSSLGSLARLAQHLSSIPIPHHVAQLVDQAISNLSSSSNHFQKGDWDKALRSAGVAYEKAEKAFFDKAMVGQVYFPDEHKVAVYLPLLGPIGVPLVVGLLKEIKRFVRKG